MTTRTRALPQAPTTADEALSLVCTLPSPERGARRLGMREILARATSAAALPTGIALSFPASEESARMLLDLVLAERDCCARFRYAIISAPPHDVIELRVEAHAELVAPLKSLYLDLAREAGHDV